ncbi:MAG: hypothetical protein ACJ0K4_02285 [Verrucomicrobiales bacterium]
MKNPKRLVSVLLAVIALVISSCGEEKSGGDESNKVATALKGKLIELKGGKIVDGEISENLDYYVLYHSASW